MDRTIRINEKHLGNGASKEQAERMVEWLRERGYDASYGQGSSERIEDTDWLDCLDIIREEFLQP